METKNLIGKEVYNCRFGKGKIIEVTCETSKFIEVAVEFYRRAFGLHNLNGKINSNRGWYCKLIKNIELNSYWSYSDFVVLNENKQLEEL